jgi:hypothetical protein
MIFKHHLIVDDVSLFAFSFFAVLFPPQKSLKNQNKE